MIQQVAVVNAYWRALRFKMRLVKIESEGRIETDAEQDERLEAITYHSTLETQYLAEQT